MTDRYLFRGFHPCENGQESVMIEGEEIKGRWIESNCIVQDPKLKLLLDKVKLFDWEKENWVEVIPETIGQYTGVEDIFGNKIFEHDIVQDRGKRGHTGFPKCQDVIAKKYPELSEYGQVGEVVFSIDGCVGSCGCCFDAFVGTGFYCEGIDLLSCVVLGNIHSNPDILEIKQ